MTARHYYCSFVAILFYGSAFPLIAVGARFTPGDLLVTSPTTLFEYTRSGHLVQSITVPYPGQSAVRLFLGIGADSQGNAIVGNFSFSGDSYLSTYNSSAGTWQHLDLAPYAPSNLADGDVALFENYAYLYGRRVDRSDSSIQQVPTSALPGPPPSGSGMSIGLDGLMYVVNAGSPQWQVRVTNPINYSFVKDLQLFDSQGTRLDIRGIAAAPDGTIFAADFNGFIYKYNSSGALQSELNTHVFDLLTLELDPDGTLVAGGRFGDVVVTDASFHVPLVFSASQDNTYVYFVPAVPEPGTSTLAISGGMAILVLGYRRYRSSRSMKCDERFHHLH